MICLRRAALLVALYLLTGCMPTIGYNLPTTPEATLADVTACQQAARSKIKDRDARYAGCMLARSYQVSIGLGKEVLEHAGFPYVHVEATISHDASEATEDLVACRQVARATVTDVNPSPAEMEKAFQKCAGSRGYMSSHWLQTGQPPP